MSGSNNWFYDVAEGLKADVENEQQKKLRVSQVIVQWPKVTFFEIIKGVNSSE
jgi:hypothetical protein